jgi:hypothetical protein
MLSILHGNTIRGDERSARIALHSVKSAADSVHRRELLP